MKPNKILTPSIYVIGGTAIAMLLLAAPITRASTIWNGPTTNYTQPDVDYTQPANQDRLTANVWLTRGSTHPMFNAKTETFYSGGTSPANTEWAVGTLDQIGLLTFQPWSDVIGGNGGSGPGPKNMIGTNLVLHLMAPDDIYLSVVFTAWTPTPAFDPSPVSGFTYTRSTPAVALPTPSISITNPAGGSVFAAPAGVHLAANATVSSGTITNVAFFGNVTPLGSVTNAPFTITSSGLTAGSYSLTAVATAAGVSATSAVVNITVVNAVTVSNSAPQITNNVFAFDYNANPGLRYVVQNSSNLSNWTSLITNMPASSPVHFEDSFVPNATKYYRVVRLPNP